MACARRLPMQMHMFLPHTFAILLLIITSHSAEAQSPVTASDEIEEPFKTGPVVPADDPMAPRRHFRLKDPAKLSGADAERIYAGLKDKMARRYRLSKIPGSDGYQKWKRYNRVPYRSASHGQRYLNNYANQVAGTYGRFEQAGTLPVGSIIAKDSITVSGDGSAVPGALFVMEKMPDGFNHASGNWRYTMIMPDGSIFGTTRGDGTDKVRFCVSCHLAVEHQDHLFFVPKDYRPQ